MVEIVRELFRLFEGSGYRLYLVGGCVRDLLLGRCTDDYDLATDAPPEISLGLLENSGYRVCTVGLDFGTVGISHRESSGNVHVQITTFRRSESYSLGSRHPAVEYGVRLEDDLARRDFTINAIAMDSSGRLIDPMSGIHDLRRMLLRTPGDPETTFEEDPLRMLRGFRFMATLGFRLEDGAISAVSRLVASILDISRERWKMEMDGLLGASDPSGVASALSLMMQTGLLQQMIPEFSDMLGLDPGANGGGNSDSFWQHTLRTMEHAPSNDLCVRWAILLHEIGKPYCLTEDSKGAIRCSGHERESADIARRTAEQFRFSRKEKSCVHFLVLNQSRPKTYSSRWSDRAVRKLQKESGEFFHKLMELARADAAAEYGSSPPGATPILDQLEKRLENMTSAEGTRVLPRELGSRLLEMIGSDMASAPAIGVILNNLEEVVRSGDLPAMAAPEVYLQYLAEHPEIKDKHC